MDLAQASELLTGVAIRVVGVAAIVPIGIAVLALTAHWALDKRHGVER